MTPAAPLKLLIYCYEYPPIGGGAGNALAHLAREWAAKGHAVTIVTSGFGHMPDDTVENGVRVIRLAVGRRSLSRGRLIEMLRYLHASEKTCESQWASVRPDLTVAFMTLPSGAAPLRLRVRQGTPFVTELRGGDVPGFLPGLLGLFHALTRARILRIWKASSLVIANSQGLADLAHRAERRIRFEVVPNGVDTRTFCPAPAAERRSACRCLFVGRLVDGQKKVSRLINVVARRPELELVIVGAGPDEARLRALAAQSAGANRIFFKGWLKDDELVRTYQTADVYASASVGEGMSNAALEALACGLPLVLSRISGHAELVAEGENGFLFDAASTAELEQHLVRLAADPSLRERMGKAGRERAVREFDWSALAEQHLALYRRALLA